LHVANRLVEQPEAQSITSNELGYCRRTGPLVVEREEASDAPEAGRQRCVRRMKCGTHVRYSLQSGKGNAEERNRCTILPPVW
jgi:hypothetical protein